MNGDNHQDQKYVWRKRVVAQAIVGVLILLLFIGAGWYLSSPSFNQLVRSKLVAEMERVTGGRVEIGSFEWNLSELQFDARDITIHGLEARGQLPYAHIDHAIVRLKIISVVREKIGVRFVGLQHPVVHLITYPDSSTNQPSPKAARPPQQNSVEQLFAVAIQRIDVKNGELILNDRHIPLDFTAADVSARMDYGALPKRYDGQIVLGKLDLKLRDFRPFASVAEARFTIFPNAAELTSLRWRSGASGVVASGRLTDFNHPQIQLTYQSSIDLAEAGATARVREVQRGSLRFDGRFSLNNGAYSSDGRFALADLDVFAPAARVRQTSLSGDYSVTNQRFSLAQLSGRVLGGTVRGDIEVINWLASPEKRKIRTARATTAEQRGRAHLQFSGVQVKALQAAVATRALPLNRMNLAGRVSGRADASWRGSPRYTQTALSFDVARPTAPSPGELPLEAHLRGTYDGAVHVLTIVDFSATTPASRLAGSGALGTTSARLKLDASTRDLGELQPIIAAFEGPKRLPINVHGQAAFVGTLSGKLSAPTLAGHLEINDFETLLVSTGQAPKTPRSVHWDLLSTALQLSPSSLSAHHGMLRRGDAHISFDFNTGLNKFHFLDTSPIDARVKVQQAELADIETLAGYNYPISGTLDLTATLEGTRADPRARGHIQIESANIYGQQFQNLSANLAFVDHEAQLEDIRVLQGQARITGTAIYNVNTTAFLFNIEGSQFDLADFQKLQTQRLTIGGMLDFSAHGSGTTQAPTVNANLQFRELVLAGEKEGDFAVEAVTHGADLELSGRSNFTHANLELDGKVHLRGDYPAQLSVRFNRLDFDPLLHAYLKGRITGHSSSAGVLVLSGPLRRPRELNATGDMTQLSADIENVRLQNDGPIRFAVAQQQLNLQSCHLVGDGTDITATGSVQLAEPRNLDLRANGQINLKILQTLNPEYMSSGMMTVALRIGGTISAPFLRGRVQIKDGSLAEVHLPSGLSEINGTLAFNEDRLRVDSLTARTGGGTLKLGGFITYDRNVNFNLTAQGTDVRLRYPPGMSTTANIDLQLTGSLASSQLAGDIVVTRFQVNRNFDFASYVARAKQPASLTPPDSPLSRLNLDVGITTLPELNVQTSIARVSGDADLHVRGTAAKPVLLGRVDIAQGEVNFSGTKYHLERGDITFSNPVRIQPVLDLEATARVRDYDVTLRFTGELDKLNTSYSSEPPLPTADIIALLAMGRTREESAIEQPATSFTQTASNAILGEALNATVSNRLQKLFGVSRIKIDPQAGGAENNPTGTRVTIEQQVSNKVTLTYITNVSQASQQIIQAEYYLTKNVSVIALRDQNGVVSMDVRIRQRKK